MLSFDQWRINIVSNADARGIHSVTDMKGDVALRLFWERGTAPTVQAVLDRGIRVEQRSPRPLLAKAARSEAPGGL